MSYLGMKQLLEAGVHFGHETKRWNPKMKRYIFAERNGIFIIDLQKTLVESEKAFDYLRDMAIADKTILFVGTKKQAQEILAAEAKRSGMPFVNERWLGGLLTNFRTIRGRVERLKELEKWFEDESILRFTKKEQIDLGKELNRLQRYLGGIRDMTRLPDVLFVIDPAKEAIAVNEANKLGIPVVALADTDTAPDLLECIIPCNDDAIRSIQLVTARLSDLIVEVKGGAEVPAEAAAQADTEGAGDAEAAPVREFSSAEDTIRQAAGISDDGSPAAQPAAPAETTSQAEPTEADEAVTPAEAEAAVAEGAAPAEAEAEAETTETEATTTDAAQEETPAESAGEA